MHINRLRTLATLTALLGLAFGCRAEPAGEPQPVTTETTMNVAPDNSFGVDLYAELIKAGKGNTFFSPYSIRTALAMTYAGAGGKTAQEMASVLHFDSVSSEQLNSSFSSLIKSLNPDHKNYELTVANALWGQSGFEFRKEFEDLLANDYLALMHEMDFARAFEPARLEINKWVDAQTHDKIKDLLAPRTVDATTRLILTNAIYFKAAWNEPFNKERTRDDPFHLDAMQQPTVPMMHHAKNTLRYLAGDQFQMAELPYKGNELSMILIVPNAIDGLPAVENEMTGENLKKWLDGMDYKSVVLTMPKFKMTGEFQLADVLKKMGMADAFDVHRADFSKMISEAQAKTEPLFISDVVHKAFVTVDEDGTEAAAATAVVMMAGSAMMANPPPPIEVTADRPFMFLIRHQKSGVVLFMGRVVDPR